MTNDNLISGQVAMAVSSSSLKHSLRSATKAKKETLEEEAVLVHDEEKMMNDEEVTSVESNDDDDVERTMLTVALMKSVVDQRIPVDKDADDAAATCNNNNDDSLKQRLRKRRRRSGQDLERLERFQSTSEGGLAHSASATATADVKKPEKTISRPKPERTTSSSLRSLRTALDRPLSKAPLPSISENEFVLNSLSDQIPQSLHGTNIKLEASTMTSAAAKAAFPAPCPLLAATFLDDFTVAIVESPTAINDGLRKVNFTEPLCETTARMRGFSIDLDCEYIAR